MRSSAVILAVMLAAGCSPTPPGPALSPEDFPKAIADLEGQIEAITDAFKSGSPADADRPLHQVGKSLSSIKRLAEPAGLSDQQLTQLDDATGTLLEALGDLHEPMHGSEFPEDFDFEPIGARVADGVAKLRAALPAEMITELDEAAAKRAASRPAAAPPAETPAPPEPAATAPPAPPADADATPPAESPAPLDVLDGPGPTPPDPADGAQRPSPIPLRLVAHSTRSRAPLCPSVLLFDAGTLERGAESVARAADLVRGAPPGDRWVQLVPTLHARLNADLSIAAYGQMLDRRASWTDPTNFDEAGDGLADRSRVAYAGVIAQAVARGLHISILPHLDPAGGKVNEWRNLYRFRPEASIGVGSYRSLLIEPLARALEAQCSATTLVDFALSGEMGRSLFEHPADYAGLVRDLRHRFAANPRTQGVRLGVALNWSGLAGGAERVDPAGVVALFRELDFVGFSCYAPVSVPPSSADFATATREFLAELGGLGGALAPNARLVYAESGVGGGYVRPGPTGPIFPSVQEVAERPFEGRGDSRIDPWSDPALSELRRQYHAALCDYLQNQNGDTPPIDKAFLWSEGPWDPQGVADRRFRDETIAAAIEGHNAIASRAP